MKEKSVILFKSGYVWVLFTLFLVLKLVGQIDWSWWWVFSPLLFGYGLPLVIYLFGMLTIVVVFVASAIMDLANEILKWVVGLFNRR